MLARMGGKKESRKKEGRIEKKGITLSKFFSSALVMSRPEKLI